MTNKEMANTRNFQALCDKVPVEELVQDARDRSQFNPGGIPLATARQASKFKNEKGLVFKYKNS
jgi:hypothetical protein